MSSTLPVRAETQMRAYGALDALGTVGMDSLVNLALDALEAITLDGRDAVRERYAACVAGSAYCEL